MVKYSYLYRYLRLSKISLKVPTADIEIKQSGLWVSSRKVPSFERLYKCFFYHITIWLQTVGDT